MTVSAKKPRNLESLWGFDYLRERWPWARPLASEMWSRVASLQVPVWGDSASVAWIFNLDSATYEHGGFSQGMWLFWAFVFMLPTGVLDLPQSMAIDQRPDRKFRQGFSGTPEYQRGMENEQQIPFCACSLHGVCPRVGWEWWLRSFAHPLGGAVGREDEQYPAFTPDLLLFAPGSSKVAVVFFSLFVSFGSTICPAGHAHSYF